VPLRKPYVYGKRDLLLWQKRPTYMAKETYLYGKTYLSTAKKCVLRFACTQNRGA